MKIYKTTQGILIKTKDQYFLVKEDWDNFIDNDKIYAYTLDLIKNLQPLSNATDLIKKQLLPPIGTQEIWASGVTYMRSMSARMEESKKAGGGNFYDKVYHAERPELFFKSTSYRVAGPGQPVRIRKDSAWNVPEPELTLMISSAGKIIGYTIGNDMSSRDIEGENPLYLPQAKNYDRSAAIGPCIYITEETLPLDTKIKLEIIRNKKQIFEGEISIDQIKRKLTDLVAYLYREMTFPVGSLLMTGTGIVPTDDFTLHKGDEIRISVDIIGTLVNFVE